MGMKLWIFFMFCFGLTHLIMGIMAADYAGDLNLADYNLENNTAASMAAYGSCEAENELNKLFGPDFDSQDWIETQVPPVGPAVASPPRCPPRAKTLFGRTPPARPSTSRTVP